MALEKKKKRKKVQLRKDVENMPFATSAHVYLKRRTFSRKGTTYPEWAKRIYIYTQYILLLLLCVCLRFFRTTLSPKRCTNGNDGFLVYATAQKTGAKYDHS